MEIRFFDITDGFPESFYYDAFVAKASECFPQWERECGKCIKRIYTDTNGQKMGLIFRKNIFNPVSRQKIIQETWIIITREEYSVMRRYI